jgi:hypothetical protein
MSCCPHAVTLRRVLLVGAVGLLACGVVFWARVVRPHLRHFEFSQRTHAELKTLARKRPPELTRNQWHHIVARTLNAHRNTIPFCTKIPPDEMDRFESELQGRLAGPAVDLATIDWIWDELARLCPSYGPSYSDHWRPTSREKLAEFEEQGPQWAGIEVD